MGILYIDDKGAEVSFAENTLIIRVKGAVINQLPIETVESIIISSSSQIKSYCIIECMKRDIPVLFTSINGRYWGKLSVPSQTNSRRQRLQVLFSESENALIWCRKIIDAKIHNQRTILRRYSTAYSIDVKDNLNVMELCREKLGRCRNIAEIMGYEGTAAKVYFEGLNKMVLNDFFHFSGRSRRPPKDPFNALLSFGYTLLTSEMQVVLDAKGLNSYLGILHKDALKHPALASDMIEEWRAVIVDTMVLGLVNGKEITENHFQNKNDVWRLTKPGIKIYMEKFVWKIMTMMKYLDYDDSSNSYRTAFYIQANHLVSLLESNDMEVYCPVKVR